ncbi:hypothetical protein FRB95_012520 [Tulasnella sp. JGI-2019a]|nr:hypothetical protein FRB93_001574 [Tulasnella sp. JGI-2019a]KAG9034827.1 hypothetical protein FRB95_012520 [Tulasnella sp. JGI-2019a]
MSTLASSSEKDFQVPISTSYHPNRPSSQDSPSEPPPFRLLDAVPKCMVPFVPIFLFGSMGIFSVARLDNLLTEGNDDEWIAYRDAVVTRVNNINVVGSLFITGAAVFMSTVSTNQDLADWGSRTSFLAFGGTVGTAMLAILAGCIISYILMDMQAADLRVSQRETFYVVNTSTVTHPVARSYTWLTIRS